MGSINFKSLASDAVASSFVMSGRQEMKNDAVIAGFPNGVTVTAFDIVPVTRDDGGVGEMAVYQIAENDAVYCKGGSAHVKIFKAWLDAAPEGSNAETVSAELKAAGGVKMKLHKQPLHGGKTYTVIDII